MTTEELEQLRQIMNSPAECSDCHVLLTKGNLSEHKGHQWGLLTSPDISKLVGTIWEGGVINGINRHEDHEATCVCCKYLENDFEGDLSDVSAGDGVFFKCRKEVFFRIGPGDIYDIFPMGRRCVHFEGRSSPFHL